MTALFTDLNTNSIDLGAIMPGAVSWRSPSNIAIIKYWGKHGIQLPKNPNISFTLSEAYTETTLFFERKEKRDDKISLMFLFDGKPNRPFSQRIEKHLSSILIYFPFLTYFALRIESTNSFPHSSGIASSASSMSALALCLCSLENLLYQTLNNKEHFFKKASFIARLGSGSAARSVYPVLSTWGKSKSYNGSDDLFAIPADQTLHPSFKTLQDTILLVSKSEKSVSSTAGHALMEGNPFAEIRYNTAHERLFQLSNILETGDWPAFGTIAEQEALDLHALMMTSSPSYILMEPNTLEIINRIRKIRSEKKYNIFFTLDAGPNVHVLYPESEKENILQFIKNDLSEFCQNREFIEDFAGQGPVLLNQ